MNINLSNWFYVIKNCSVDNTYKMGWGKSIVECCFEDESSELIHFDRISKLQLHHLIVCDFYKVLDDYSFVLQQFLGCFLLKSLYLVYGVWRF